MSWVMESLGLRVWLASRSTPAAAVRAAAAGPSGNRQDETEAVRQSMLAALGDAPQHRPLRLKLVHASDAEALWHLRNALMAALAARQGEAWAARQLAQLTPLFRNLVPEGLACHLGPGRTTPREP